MYLCFMLILVISSQYVDSQHNISSGKESNDRYLNNQFVRLQQQFSQLQNYTYDEIYDLKQEVSLLKKKNKELRNNITVNDHKVSRTGRKLTTLENVSELVKNNIVINVPQSSNSQCNDKIAFLESTITELQAQVSSLVNEVKELKIMKGNITSMYNSNVEIKANITTLQNSNVQMKNNITTLQSSNVQNFNALHHADTLLQKDIETLNNATTEKMSFMTLKENRLSLTELKGSVASLEASLTAVFRSITTHHHGVNTDNFTDCEEIYKSGHTTDGVYTIYPTRYHPVQVYCDMSRDGGGWTVIQRKKDGSLNFTKNWSDYKHGFGDLTGEMWLGNDNIAAITSQKSYQLYVHLDDWEGQTRYAMYSQFKVGIESNLYQLTVGTYSGTAGDSLSYVNQMKFTTYDQDHDTDSGGNCAQRYGGGGFWYRHCLSANLNGPYQSSSRVTASWRGVMWYQWHGSTYSLKSTTMKIRPITTIQERERESRYRMSALLRNISTVNNMYDNEISELQDIVKSLAETSEFLKKNLTTLHNTNTQLQKDIETVNKSTSEKMSFFNHTVDMLEETLYTHNPADCSDIYKSGGRFDGIYTIYPTEDRLLQVYCDMTNGGGGWTVIQRRKDGSVNFNGTWSDYKDGFGDLSGEMWLGNDNIASITSQKTYQLHIDLEDWEGETRYATYSQFKVGNESDLYKLTLGSYNGTSGDSLIYHNGMNFSTYDKDFDTWNDVPCAQYYGNGFWFRACQYANLNGLYQSSSYASGQKGMVWKDWYRPDGRDARYYSLKSTTMKIRPTHFN